jgi:dihydrofolate reductase
VDVAVAVARSCRLATPKPRAEIWLRSADPADPPVIDPEYLSDTNHITVDMVMQTPGRPDEDTRGRFSHGGWAIPGNDQVMGQALAERLGKPRGGLLLGRRSYEDMLASWNAQGGPYKGALNAAPKYVASTRPATRLDWPNSTLLHGDIPAAVAALKQNSGGDLVIMGSGRLIRPLPDGLIDECLLMIHPVVLGSGQRLFDHDDHVAKLRLVGSTATTTGVILATYQPA